MSALWATIAAIGDTEFIAVAEWADAARPWRPHREIERALEALTATQAARMRDATPSALPLMLEPRPAATLRA